MSRSKKFHFVSTHLLFYDEIFDEILGADLEAAEEKEREIYIYIYLILVAKCEQAAKF